MSDRGTLFREFDLARRDLAALLREYEIIRPQVRSLERAIETTLADLDRLYRELFYPAWPTETAPAPFVAARGHLLEHPARQLVRGSPLDVGRPYVCPLNYCTLWASVPGTCYGDRFQPA